MLKAYSTKPGERAGGKLKVNRLPGLRILPDRIPLTGIVQGRRATEIEERFARALTLARLSFRFQVRFSTVASLPGHERVVDFVVRAGGWHYPVEVDGPFGHTTSAQLGLDAVRESLLNEIFIRRGMALLQRVMWYQLETQEMADATVRWLFL